VRAKMKTEKAYYIGTHHYSYRVGEAAEILGVSTCTPIGGLPRTCYHIKFKDGKEDYCPLSEIGNYKILTHEEVREQFVPCVA
jgi:hypothetical protein